MVNWDEFKFFKDQCYSRNLVLKSKNMEILLVCWKPGHKSPRHFHGPSDGVMLILEGEITNISYYPDGHEEKQLWKPGTIGHTPEGVYHEVINESESNCVSLHIYAPPLGDEYKSADAGYDNEVEFQEMELPDKAVEYLLGRIHGSMNELEKPVK